MFFNYIRITSTALVTAALFLYGCGGGGGASSLPPTPPTLTSSAKGFWSGSDGTSVILLSNGDAWMVFQEAGVVNRLARVQTRAQGLTLSGSGTLYKLQDGSSEAVSITGNFVEKQNLAASLAALSGNSTLNLAYDVRYETTASMSDVTGSWSGLYGGGVHQLTLNISATGVLAGSSTTACSYSGSLQPRSADPAVFDVRFTETCVVGTPVTLEGIATVNASKTGLSFAVVSSDGINATLFVGSR